MDCTLFYPLREYGMIKNMTPEAVKRRTRQKAWAVKQRTRIIADLGAKCNWCGSEEDLTLDCIEPRGDKHHRMGRLSRICFYRQQFFANNLQVLCKTCNGIKGPMSRRDWHSMHYARQTIEDGYNSSIWQRRQFLREYATWIADSRDGI
jgi:hypothetical protein